MTMNGNIVQARQLTALTRTSMTSTTEARLSQTLMQQPTVAKTDSGAGALHLLVEQKKQAERIEQQKQIWASNNRLNDLVAKEGNVDDLQTIIAIEHQKEAIEGGSDDEALEVMQTAVEETEKVSGNYPKELQERDTDASRMAKEIRTKAAEEVHDKADQTAEESEGEKKLKSVLQWCEKHIALVCIAMLAFAMVVRYYCNKSLDRQ